MQLLARAVPVDNNCWSLVQSRALNTPTTMTPREPAHPLRCGLATERTLL